MRFALSLVVCTLSSLAWGNDQVQAPCGGRLIVLARARGWQSRLIPASRGHLLSALHARLQEILPPDFARRVLVSARRPEPVHFASDERLAIDVFREALVLLREILAMTEAQYGDQSFETGLAHYSLALFYSVANTKESAINGQTRDLWMSEHDYNEFDRRGLHHARLALNRLVGGPSEIAARLHLIKHLVSATSALANTNRFTFDWYPMPPHEGFEEHRAEASRELGMLMESYVDSDLSTRAKRWVYLVASYEQLELEKTTARVKKRSEGRRAHVFETEDLAWQDDLRVRYEALLGVALAHRSMLPALIQERGHGVLYGLINAWRWSAYDLSLNLGFPNKRNNAIIHATERKLAEGAISVESLLGELARAGLPIPESAEVE